MSFAIETDRLLLREFAEDDWHDVHAYAADPEVVKFMDWGPNTEEDTKAFIALAMDLQHQTPRRSYELAVVFKATGRLIGGASLRVQAGDPRTAELGYTFHPGAWGRGLATEAAKALVQFGFQRLGVQRVFATCRPENTASYRVLRKAGLHFEEYLQNVKIVRGQLVDAFLCGLAREEWAGPAST